MSARDKWRKTVTEASAGFRLDCVSIRIEGAESELVKAAISELLRLRITARLLPLFRALDDLEVSYSRLASTTLSLPKDRRSRLI